MRSSWLLNGAGVGDGRNAVLAEFGWPGFGMTYLHGATSTTDVGIALGFNYGFEGIPEIGTLPGIRLNAVLRLNLADDGKLNVGARFSPGVFTYFYDYEYGWRDETETWFGISLPLELAAGYLVLPQLSVNVGISMPIAIKVTGDAAPYSEISDGGTVLLPVLPGFGAEYRATDDLSITFESGFGPSIVIGEDSSDVEFAFKMLVGAGYRF
jgi:hypothetical protein